MITKENFLELLKLLKFSKKTFNVFEKAINNEQIIVDLKEEKIIYPKKIKIFDETTSNLSKNENFVVLECVCKLLEKGYKAENIELEPKWKLGHEKKGGKADILVRDRHNTTLLLIECKTAGNEFEKEWKQMKQDGGQLFSYFKQDRNAKYLCLYTSDIINNKIQNLYHLISVKDNNEYIKNKKIKTYEQAKTQEEIFEVWEQTYENEYNTKGLFEEDIQPYNIGKLKYNLNDLQNVDNVEKIGKIYHKYRTILRKHNVSGGENAFDKLVNLFLAKIVDETNNKNDLQFYWNFSYDNEFDLQDRLQKLYRDGMKKYLGEEVTYIGNDQIQNAFKLFKNDPDQTKETILKYFRQLKFFTNNDFAFIDVHNEELFKNNSKILIETVKMLQDIKLKSDKNSHQLLGDLFENFLNQGIKQRDGQYFTALPIVRFIVSSLPLKNMVANNKEPLNVIDYACGAGHFLTEYAQQISNLVEDPKKYYSHIFGIEKESRLVKVSKVSAFMFGKGEIKILYNDGLIENKNIKNNSFDLLIANPPYSVKGFLDTLKSEERQNYELYNKNTNINLNTDVIETFFVERAKQLLKEDGFCAIILPSTIITNKDKILIDTQKIILKYFSIVAIVSLPQKTFGKTGQETIVLFMQKRKENPNLIMHYKNRIDCWFKNDFSKDKLFEDFHYVEDYCKYTNQKLETYKQLFINKDEKKIENEKEKLFYYILAKNNSRKVLVVKSPTETKKIQEFLGYKWTERKGIEGILYLNQKEVEDDDELKTNEINSIKTPLFNPLNLEDETKINTLIRKHFCNEVFVIQENLQKQVFLLNLEDMLDFSRDKFLPNININAMSKIEINSIKYPKQLLSNLVVIKEKSKFQVNFAKDNSIGKYPFFTSGDKIYKYDEFLVDNENLFIATGGKANIKFYNGKASYSTDTLCIKSNDEKNCKTKYLFHILYSMIYDINSLAFKGGILKHLQKDIFFNIEIPLPHIEIQNKIINEISKIEEQEKIANLKIINNEESIKLKIKNAINDNKLIKFNLFDKTFKLLIGKRVLDREMNIAGDLPIYSANVMTSKGKILSVSRKNPINNFNTDSILWGIDGDWMVNFITKNIPFFPTDHCGVLRTNNSNINLKFLSYIFYDKGKEENFSRTNRASIDRISRLSLTLPPIEVQNKVVKEINKLEEEIKISKEILSKIPTLKQEIIDKYLK